MIIEEKIEIVHGQKVKIKVYAPVEVENGKPPRSAKSVRPRNNVYELNHLVKEIRKRQGYSRRQAYYRATRLLDEINQMDKAELTQRKAALLLERRGLMIRLG